MTLANATTTAPQKQIITPHNQAFVRAEVCLH